MPLRLQVSGELRAVVPEGGSIDLRARATAQGNLGGDGAVLDLTAQITPATSNDATPLTLADLRGKNVAITNGYTYPSAFVNDSRISKLPANSDDNLIQMFLSKRVDYVVMNRTPGWLRIDATDAARGRLVHRGALSADEFWIAFSKKYPGAQQASDTFGKGLTQMRNNGSYQAMLDEFRKQVKVR